MPFDREPSRIPGDAFWKAATDHALEKAGRDAAKRTSLEAAFRRIEVYRKIVLNPLSHSAATIGYEG